MARTPPRAADATTADRFRQRARDLRRRSWFRRLVVLLVVLLLGVGVWLVELSSVLAVRHTDVEGTKVLTRREVLARADVPAGRPLARVDTVAIEQRIARLPLVETVEVGRSWPRTISIDVTERTAVAWIRDGSTIKLVDRFGVAFRTFPRRPRTVVEITGEQVDARQRQQAREEAAAVLERLRTDAPDVYRATTSVDADTKDAVTLRLTRGRLVVWGSEGRSAAKIKVLRPLLKIRAQRYDVSAPEQPTTRR